MIRPLRHRRKGAGSPQTFREILRDPETGRPFQMLTIRHPTTLWGLPGGNLSSDPSVLGPRSACEFSDPLKSFSRNGRTHGKARA